MPSTPTLTHAWRDAQLTYLSSSNFLYGTADEGTTVQLLNNGSVFMTVNVLPGGIWHTNDTRMPDGSYHVTVISINAAGVASAPSPVYNFLIDDTAPAAPTITLNDPGLRNTLPARFSGTAEAGATVALNFGQGLRVDVPAYADGSWSSSLDLADGNYLIQVTARDAAGNVSAPTQLTLNRQVSDDAGSDAASAGTLLVGTAAHGAINYRGDVDWFKVNLSALTSYSFSLKGALSGGGTLPSDTGSHEASLQLWNARADAGRGAFVRLDDISGFGGDPVMSATITDSGDYYLIASARSQMGSYTLSALVTSRDDHYDDPAHATPIAVGAAVAGRFERAGDVDAFKVDLAKGSTYVFELDPGANTPDTRTLSMTLFDGVHTPGTFSSLDNDGRAFLSYTAMAGGSYFLSVNNFFSTGNYVLKVSAPPDDYSANTATSGKLTVGASTSGTLEVSGDHDWFGIALQADTAYSFALDGGPAGYPTLAVFDALGGIINLYARDMTNGKFLTWTPSVSGTYFFDVGNLMGTTAYTLQTKLSEIDDHGASAASAGTMAVTTNGAGRIESPGDVDWYRVSLKANVMYTFDVRALPEGANTGWYGVLANLVDASGHQLSYGNATTETTRVNYQPAASGDYYLTISAYNQIFNYTISPSRNDEDLYLATSATSGTLQPGALLRSAIDFLGDADWIKVDLQAGQSYSFALSGSLGLGGTLASPTLALYDTNGSFLSYGYNNYDGVVGLQYNASKSGTYYVAASGAGTGTYLLKEANKDVPFADTTPPTVLLLRAPVYNSDDPATANLSLEFSEAIIGGSGTITLRLASGEVVETFAAGSARISIDSAARTLTIDPSAPLLGSTDYRLQAGATAITDKAGLALAADYTASFHTASVALNVVGGSGNDSWVNTSRSDTIDGGAGIDTVRYYGKATAFGLAAANGGPGWVVNAKDGSAAHDTLVRIERIVFDDSAMAFDSAGTAGQSYRLYQAAFNRVPDAAGVGFWLGQMDKGMSLHAVAQSFLASVEFTSMFGAAPTDDAFVTALYGNVLHRTPDQAGHDFWAGALQQGANRADVLAGFSESTENQAAVAAIIGNGISYIPYG